MLTKENLSGKKENLQVKENLTKNVQKEENLIQVNVNLLEKKENLQVSVNLLMLTKENHTERKENLQVREDLLMLTKENLTERKENSIANVNLTGNVQ